jgi:large subunit ribosomal protein L6
VSRLGKSPIVLPKGAEVKQTNRIVTVKGPKGTLSLDLPEGIEVKIEEGLAYIVKDEAVDMAKPVHGLYRAMLNNLIIGVTTGFERKLNLIGVGYRATVQGNVLDLQLGYSHPTQVPIPQNIQVAVDKSVTISVTGVDKQAVGQFAAAVRAMRPPEPYKGKGIRYENEFVRKKAGKAAKGKAG